MRYANYFLFTQERVTATCQELASVNHLHRERPDQRICCKNAVSWHMAGYSASNYFLCDAVSYNRANQVRRSKKSYPVTEPVKHSFSYLQATNLIFGPYSI